MKTIDPKAAAMIVLGRMLDRGRLVESGWDAYCTWNPPEICECSPCHEAFEAGASHLFAAVVMLLEPDKWHADSVDRRRLQSLANEMNEIAQRFALRHAEVAGHG